MKDAPRDGLKILLYRENKDPVIAYWGHYKPSFFSNRVYGAWFKPSGERVREYTSAYPFSFSHKFRGWLPVPEGE